MIHFYGIGAAVVGLVFAYVTFLAPAMDSIQKISEILG